MYVGPVLIVLFIGAVCIWDNFERSLLYLIWDGSNVTNLRMQEYTRMASSKQMAAYAAPRCIVLYSDNKRFTVSVLRRHSERSRKLDAEVALQPLPQTFRPEKRFG